MDTISHILVQHNKFNGITIILLMIPSQMILSVIDEHILNFAKILILTIIILDAVVAADTGYTCTLVLELWKCHVL